MTKDRPRNRSSGGGKSGSFRGGGGGGKPWVRGASKRSRDEPANDASVSSGGGDKPRGAGAGKMSDEGAGGRSRRFQNRPHRAGGDAERTHRAPPRPERRDGRRHRDGQYERREAAFEDGGEVWIWGAHAAGAALANPRRKVSKALMTRNAAQRAALVPEALPAYAELLEAREIDERLPAGAVHQGLAVRCAPLDGLDISDAAVAAEKVLVILDQVTDPQNVGAVFRSAAAFGLGGVVMQTRNAPALGGALAKAAAGAIERVEEIRAVNISRAIDTLRDAGWRVVGLDGGAEHTLEQAFAGDEPLAIVLGAEGAGMRPGVAKACTGLARIPIGEGMESLNVSNAAAIAFYEAGRRRGATQPPAKPAFRRDSDGLAERADEAESD